MKYICEICKEGFDDPDDLTLSSDGRNGVCTRDIDYFAVRNFHDRTRLPFSTPIFIALREEWEQSGEVHDHDSSEAWWAKRLPGYVPDGED